MGTLKKKTKPQRTVGKIDTIEKLAVRMDIGFADVYKRMDTGFADAHGAIEKLALSVANGFAEVRTQFDDVYTRFDTVDARFDTVDSSLSSIRREVEGIRGRLEYLEEQIAMQSGYAKEIDYLLERVSRIEKHLNLV